MNKILVNEYQDVNAHVHSTVCKSPRDWPDMEKWQVFVWMQWCMYHEYQGIWTATSGERMKFARKIGNCFDLVAVAIHFSFHSLIHCMNHRWLKVFVD